MPDVGSSFLSVAVPRFPAPTSPNISNREFHRMIRTIAPVFNHPGKKWGPRRTTRSVFAGVVATAITTSAPAFPHWPGASDCLVGATAQAAQFAPVTERILELTPRLFSRVLASRSRFLTISLTSSQHHPSLQSLKRRPTRLRCSALGALAILKRVLRAKWGTGSCCEESAVKQRS